MVLYIVDRIHHKYLEILYNVHALICSHHVSKSATLPFEMWAKLECVSNCDFVVQFGNSDIIVHIISLCGISRGE